MRVCTYVAESITNVIPNSNPKTDPKLNKNIFYRKLIFQATVFKIGMNISRVYDVELNLSHLTVLIYLQTNFTVSRGEPGELLARSPSLNYLRIFRDQIRAIGALPVRTFISTCLCIRAKIKNYPSMTLHVEQGNACSQ